MTRIGIFSDTHSTDDPRYAIHFADCQQVWHAGDVGDARLLRHFEQTLPGFRAVAGNIDHGDVTRRLKTLEIFEVEGVRVLLTHIGGYPGRYAPGMKKLLVDSRINLFVCGHSHILKVMPDRDLGLLHVNPGAAGVHGWQKERTLVKLTIDNGRICDLQVIELAKTPAK